MIETKFIIAYIVFNLTILVGLYFISLSETKRNKIFGKLSCKLGYHEWKWSLGRDEGISIMGNPPKNAKCSRCAIPYSKK